MSKTEIIGIGGTTLILGAMIVEFHYTRKELRRLGKEINYFEECEQIIPKKRFTA